MNHPGSDTLLAHVDGELDAAAERQVLHHVGSCDECRSRVSQLHATSESFAGAVARLDESEPVAWQAASAEEAVVLRLPQKRVPVGPRLIRWAAGFVLLTSAAAAAVVLGIPRIGGPDDSAAPASTGEATAPAAAGAIVAVAPVDGSLDVVLTGAAAGTHVIVTFHDGADARVELSSTAPHFGTRAGRVDVDLRGAADTLIVTYPRAIRAGTVRLDQRALAVIREGTVTATAPTADVTVAIR